MATNDNDWFGNVIQNWILQIIISFIWSFGYSFFLFFLFPLIGQPEFFEQLIVGFGLVPTEVEDIEGMIN